MIQFKLPLEPDTRPTLFDVPIKTSFMWEGKVYIKHNLTGPVHNKCYNLTDLTWCTLPRGIPIQKVNLDCRISFI